MEKRKIIFFDIDGTVYDYRTGIEPSTRRAISMLRDNGHIPVLCTGRAKAMISRELIDLGFRGLVGACGTYVEYENRPVKNIILSQKELAIVVKSAERYQIRAVFEGADGLHYMPQLSTPEYLERTEQLKSKYSRVTPINEQSQINKLTVHFHEMEELDGFLSEVKGILEPIIHREPEDYNYAECVPVGWNKAAGIEVLLQYLEIDRKDTYAFGDSVNDLEMLAYVNYGIAMGNSSKEVLEAAKYRTSGMYQDGIYNGLKDFQLI